MELKRFRLLSSLLVDAPGVSCLLLSPETASDLTDDGDAREMLETEGEADSVEKVDSR